MVPGVANYKMHDSEWSMRGAGVWRLCVFGMYNQYMHCITSFDDGICRKCHSMVGPLFEFDIKTKLRENECEFVYEIQVLELGYV